MFRNRRSKRIKETNAELNITAFMNLMVVLVPFLLITAVFSQVSILKLNLPDGSSEVVVDQKEPPKALDVIIRKNRFQVVERSQSLLLKTIMNKDDGTHDYRELNSYLQKVKDNELFSDETSVTLLLEMDTEYDVLVQTMDAVRLIVREERELDENGYLIQGELFPSISMGDAPPDNSSTQTNQVGSGGT
jgi:biopolymer transport protein ExbD